jgi:hypothetical protein
MQNQKQICSFKRVGRFSQKGKKNMNKYHLAKINFTTT